MYHNYGTYDDHMHTTIGHKHIQVYMFEENKSGIVNSGVPVTEARLAEMGYFPAIVDVLTEGGEIGHGSRQNRIF